MTPVLHIELLDTCRLTYGDRPVSLGTVRQQSLLAYLVLHVGPVPRQHLAFLFWPDSSEPQARTNLRRELHHLRQALPAADIFLKADAGTLQWCSDSPFALDVVAFEKAASAAERALEAGDGGTAREALEEAVGLYRGDLLAGCYEEWIASERERLCQLYLDSLEKLTGLLEEQRDYASAIRYAQRLLRLEPLRETTARQLMRLHAARGDRAAALRVYHTCAGSLQRELGVEPSAETREAYERLRDAESQPPTRTESPPAALATTLPLVGRQREWEALLGAWRRAAREEAHFALVVGEAGIGKTRLAEELLGWAAQQGTATARTRSYAAEGRLAYAPLTEWLRSDALEGALLGLEPVWLSEVSRLLPELSRPDVPRPEPVEGWQRQRLFEALTRAFLAVGGPLLLLLDDLQWCDRDTLEWLHYLFRFSPRAPVLVLGALRSEEEGDNLALGKLVRDLQQRGNLTRITLGALNVEESAVLAAEVAGGRLESGLQSRLFATTEGQPLFIVEAVRAGLVFGAEDGRRFPLSPKVQAVISARLEQLSAEARGVAQLAATIGRAFDLRVLREASDLGEEPLVSALDELWRRAIVRVGPGGGYDFSHDRLREGADAELSPARRRLLHRRVAEALGRLHAADSEPISAQLAAHYEEAGLPEEAIAFYRRAAERANDVSASQEAILLAQRALRLIEKLPAGTARDRRELGLLNAQAAALSALKGFTPPELEAVLNRVQFLAEKLGDGEALIRSLWGLYALYIVRGNVALARSLAEKALSLAGSDSGLLTDCHQALGGVDLTEGKLSAASAHFATANRLYYQNRARRVLFGADVGVFSLAWGAHGLWLQGEVEQAREHVAQAEAIAYELRHPFTTLQASAYRSISQQLERHLENAWRSAEATVTGCERYDIIYYREWGVIVGGWVTAMRGRPDEGAARIRRGLEALRRQDAHLRRPYYLSLLAEVCLEAGKPGEAGALLDAALTVAQQNRDLWWLPELWRLRGLTEAGAKAASRFRQALSLAHEQKSRSLELRAATSLAVWLRQEGHPAEAAALLEPICISFPEALETHDLTSARALLNELT